MQTRSNLFFGWRVVGAVFLLAMFGWGVGFYGPPVYLHAVRETRGWPLELVSTAVTVHFLIGVLVIANRAEVISTVRSSRGDQVGMHCPGDRHHGLGTGAGALAAVSCDAAQRRRLGDYGRCGRERMMISPWSCEHDQLHWPQPTMARASVAWCFPRCGSRRSACLFPCGGGSH